MPVHWRRMKVVRLRSSMEAEAEAERTACGGTTVLMADLAVGQGRTDR